MTALLLSTVVGLAAALFRIRAARSRSDAAHSTAPVTRFSAVCGLLATLLGSWPVLRCMPELFAPHPVLIGDGASHAAVAHAIVVDGLARGWVDGFSGGMPFGIHYQSVGWLLMAALISVGVSPAHAFNAIGLLGVLAAPLAVYWSARTFGARPLVAATGAIAVEWIAPENGFLGGLEMFLREGLLAQTLALPLAVVAATAVVKPTRRWLSPVAFAALMATHPQIATGLCVLLLPPLLVFRRRESAASVVRGGLAAAIAGLAIYGPGLRSLHLPFGFPADMETWKQLGFPLQTMFGWVLDGRLFDKWRPPVVSFWWVFAIVYLGVSWNRRWSPLLLSTSGLALLFSSSGYLFAAMGTVGRVLLTFAMPLRVAAFIPFIIAASVMWAVTDLLRVVGPTAARIAALVVPLSLLALAAPSRLAWGAAHAHRLHVLRDDGGSECGEKTPPGFSSSMISTAIASIQRGRVTADIYGPTRYCLGAHAVEHASRVPLGMSAGAATHLGTNVTAFEMLHPSEPGAWDRAETLGIRAVAYAGRGSAPVPAGGWRVISGGDEFGVSERVGGTFFVGAACVDERWSGGEAELRDAITSDLKNGAELLNHPGRLVEIIPSSGPVTKASLPRGDCDPTGAVVQESRAPSGVVDADIDAPHDIDAVVRVTAFSRWKVDVDGSDTPWRLVAPGFLTVRVPAGHHHLHAETSWPPFYLLGIVAAFLSIVALARLKSPA